MPKIEKLEIKNNVYTKMGYTPIEVLTYGMKYLDTAKDTDAREKLLTDALFRVSVNGSQFSGLIEIENHFGNDILSLDKVRTWAFFEGLQDFFTNTEALLNYRVSFMEPEEKTEE